MLADTYQTTSTEVTNYIHVLSYSIRTRVRCVYLLRMRIRSRAKDEKFGVRAARRTRKICCLGTRLEKNL